MADIVDQLLNDPNSTLNKKDVEALRGMNKGTLKRLVLGLQTQPQAVQNQAEPAEDDPEAVVQDLKKELRETQKNLHALIGIEQDLRTALNEYGVKTESVIEQSVAVANQQAPPQSQALNGQTVWNWVVKSRDPVAYQLREGLDARKLVRQKSIDTILSCAKDIYTIPDLQRMPTVDLNKLAQVVMVNNQQHPQDNMVWDGLGLADQTMSNYNYARNDGPLDPPSTSIDQPPQVY